MARKKCEDEEPKMTAKLLNEIFNDEASRKKLIEITTLQQKERFLEHEGALCENRINELQQKLAAKHHLSMLMQVQLSMILQDAEYKMFLEKYGKEIKEKMRGSNEKNHKKRKD